MRDPKFDESRNPNIPAAGYRMGELRQMLAYLAVSAAVLWLLLEMLVRAAPYLISLKREQAWFNFVGSYLAENELNHHDADLQKLADALAQQMNLPSGSLRVYRNDDDTVNAYATFGGHIVLYQGLLDRLPDEESVAAVLAHEIAHIRHRDPLRSASRGLLFTLIGAAVGIESSSDILINLEGLHYSRQLEENADTAAAHALQRHYGNIGGALRLFEQFAKLERQHGHSLPQWASSHPDTTARLQHIRTLAAQYGWHNAPTQRNNNPWRTATRP